MRLEAVTECEHGRTEPHPTLPTLDYADDCLVGSRREASTTDLIEELKVRGAVEIYTASGVIPPDEPGWYLVFSLEGEK